MNINAWKGGNFNTLYESKGNNLSTNTRNELKVTGAQKWGAEGYIDEKTSQSEKSKFLNTTSVSNTNVGITQIGKKNKDEIKNEKNKISKFKGKIIDEIVKPLKTRENRT